MTMLRYCIGINFSIILLVLALSPVSKKNTIQFNDCIYFITSAAFSLSVFLSICFLGFFVAFPISRSGVYRNNVHRFSFCLGAKCIPQCFWTEKNGSKERKVERERNSDAVYQSIEAIPMGWDSIYLSTSYVCAPNAISMQLFFLFTRLSNCDRNRFYWNDWTTFTKKGA